MTASRTAGHKDAVRVAPFAGNIPVHPGKRLRHILNLRWKPCIRIKPVIDRNHPVTLGHKTFCHRFDLGFIATMQPATVDPHNRGKPLRLWQVKIQLIPALGILGILAVNDITNNPDSAGLGHNRFDGIGRRTFILGRQLLGYPLQFLRIEETVLITISLCKLEFCKTGRHFITRKFAILVAVTLGKFFRQRFR